MKWEEIPKFISTDSCYHVNYGIVGYIKAIDGFEADGNHKLQMNPDFQRGHVWTEDQQIAYIEYILRGGKSGLSFYFNMPSWRTRHGIQGYDDFVCVDGLQRTTAIRKFLDNELMVFGQYYKDFDGKLGRTEFPVDMYINDLKTKADVLTWYIQMNAGGTPHSKEEIEKVQRLLKECEEKWTKEYLRN